MLFQFNPLSMKIKILTLFCIVLTCQLAHAQTTRIASFDELMISLNAGEQVRVVIHYSLCKWPADKKDQSPVPDAITGMNVDIYEYFAPATVHNKLAFVVFSNSKLIQNPIGKGFVYNYGKVRINADNSVQVTAKYIHPKSFKVVMDEVFIGRLNDGENGEGIDLYVQ